MNLRTTIATVVEGAGEIEALPLLVRRIAGEVFGRWDVDLPRPHRLPRGQMTTGENLRVAVRVQSARVRTGGVLVVTDADDACAVTFADQLRELAKPVPVEVAVAVREFEAWFLAAIDSLRQHREVRPDAALSGDPEAPRGAKETLSALMSRPYRETRHQPSFAMMMDLGQGRRARSFEHLVGCVGRLLGASAGVTP